MSESTWPDVIAMDQVSKADIGRLSNRYPLLIRDLSNVRMEKQSKKTLMELDAFRYVELPATVASRCNGASDQKSKHGFIELVDLQELLEWKMSRGVFRPALRGLVSSNALSLVKQTSAAAFNQYAEFNDRQGNPEQVIPALKTLCKLRGVGPATGSLILSVAFPNDVPFFADELYAWTARAEQDALESLFRQRYGSDVASGPGKRIDKVLGMKYTEAEYKSLLRSIIMLRERLNTNSNELNAQDIEKAAYVVIQGREVPASKQPKTEANDNNTTMRLEDPSAKTIAKLEAINQTSKQRKGSAQKPESNRPSEQTSVTRSASRSTRSKDLDLGEPAAKRRKQ